MHTHTHTYIHMYIHTYIHMYIHTYVHTYIHMYIHTYITDDLTEFCPDVQAVQAPSLMIPLGLTLMCLVSGHQGNIPFLMYVSL